MFVKNYGNVELNIQDVMYSRFEIGCAVMDDFIGTKYSCLSGHAVLSQVLFDLKSTKGGELPESRAIF